MMAGVFMGVCMEARNDLMYIAGVRHNPGSGCES